MREEPLRVVFDPGVLVAGFISTGGATSQLVSDLGTGRFLLVVSPRLLAELHGVLLRDKFRSYATPAEVDAYIAQLRARAELVPDPPEVPQVSRDPDDDYLVALARAASADALISGDKDLTGLQLPDLAILSPRKFVGTLST